MSISEGIEAFYRVLDHGFPHVAVSTQDMDALIAKNQPGFIHRRKLATAGATSPVNRDGHAPPIAVAVPVPVPVPDEMQRVLVEVWQEVLGGERVDLYTSFFDLHGDSLLAIKMISRLRERLGVALTPHVLFAHPTIDRLLRFLREPAASRTATASSRVVTIRGTDRGTPTFFVHPVGGTVLCYAGLAARWPGEGAFYALPARGLEEDVEPLGTVEEMAASYIEALKGVQPEGPYRLGGWSMGGLIAFEMSRRLQERGDIVEQLVLIDSASPATDRNAGNGDRALEQARGQEIVSPDVSREQLERLIRVFKANYGAWVRYRCEEPLRSRVARTVAFFAQERDAHAAEIEIENWRRAVSGRLQVHHVPGDHDSILQGTNLESLIDHLGRELSGPAPDR